jgi:hypothetical protein
MELYILRQVAQAATKARPALTVRLTQALEMTYSLVALVMAQVAKAALEMSPPLTLTPTGLLHLHYLEPC